MVNLNHCMIYFQNKYFKTNKEDFGMNKYNVEAFIEVYYDLINILKDFLVFKTDINYIKENIFSKIKGIKFFLELEIDNLLNQIESGNQCDLLEYIKYYESLKLISKKLHIEIDNFYKNIQNINDASIEYIKDFFESIEHLVEEYDDPNINLSLCYKCLLDDENYEILTKYNCFNPIIKTMKSNKLKSFDIIDFKNFFYKTSIIKIINGDKEILLSSLKPNKFLIIGFEECDGIEEIKSKIQFYKTECYNNDCEYIFGKNNKLLVVYLLDK